MLLCVDLAVHKTQAPNSPSYSSVRIVRGWISTFLPPLRQRDYLCATDLISGKVKMNENVDSEETNCKLTMGTAAATVGHRAYFDQICVLQSM